MGSIPGLGRSPGGRNGDPLQYSCLKNPPDRGAWQAPVRRVTKIQMPSLHAAHKVSIPTPGDRPTLGVWVTHGTWPCLGDHRPSCLGEGIACTLEPSSASRLSPRVALLTPSRSTPTTLVIAITLRACPKRTRSFLSTPPYPAPLQGLCSLPSQPDKQ